jgi:hypothetical protein
MGLVAWRACATGAVADPAGAPAVVEPPRACEIPARHADGTAGWSARHDAALTALRAACVARGHGARRAVCGPGRAAYRRRTERSGVEDEFTRGVAAGAPSLAAALEACGVRTLGLPADAVAHAGSGLAGGFSRYAPEAPALEDSARVDSALAWLADGGPRFAWLGLSMDAHADPWRRVDGLGPRDPVQFVARARRLDDALARLVAGLARDGLAESTLVVVTGGFARPGADARVTPFARPGVGSAALSPRRRAWPMWRPRWWRRRAATRAGSRGWIAWRRGAHPAAAPDAARRRSPPTRWSCPRPARQGPGRCWRPSRRGPTAPGWPPGTASARPAAGRGWNWSARWPFRAPGARLLRPTASRAQAAAPGDPRPAAPMPITCRSGRHALVPRSGGDYRLNWGAGALAPGGGWAGVPDFVAAESEAPGGQLACLQQRGSCRPRCMRWARWPFGSRARGGAERLPDALGEATLNAAYEQPTRPTRCRATRGPTTSWRSASNDRDARSTRRRCSAR